MVSEVQDLAHRASSKMPVAVIGSDVRTGRHHSLDQILQTVTSGACEALAVSGPACISTMPIARKSIRGSPTELEIEEIRSPIDRGVTGCVAPPRGGEHSRSRLRPPLELGLDNGPFPHAQHPGGADHFPHEDRLIASCSC